jgi:hypothetical protein
MSNGMSLTERLRFLEQAVEELRLELAKIEVGLVKNGNERGTFTDSLRQQHQDLANMLRDQHAALTRILNDTMIELDKLRGSAE